MPTASVLLQSSVKYGQGSEEHDLSGIANAMGSIPRPPKKEIVQVQGCRESSLVPRQTSL